MPKYTVPPFKEEPGWEDRPKFRFARSSPEQIEIALDRMTRDLLLPKDNSALRKKLKGK